MNRKRRQLVSSFIHYFFAHHNSTAATVTWRRKRENQKSKENYKTSTLTILLLFPFFCSASYFCDFNLNFYAKSSHKKYFCYESSSLRGDNCKLTPLHTLKEEGHPKTSRMTSRDFYKSLSCRYRYNTLLSGPKNKNS